MLINGIVAHLIADWIFQNDWMARNKTNLRHPAAWVHSGIHLIAMLFIFPIWAAILIAGMHMLIDTRKPVQFWQRIFRQTTKGPSALTVSIWLDQVFHITILAIVVALIGFVNNG
ncbi:MAG: DUF3307 domain-containing protein [Chloroflexi bacterium]|nr:DUF3307 domain-containing protein [Chloroflexota bacterium]